ncbi:MAG: VCBS repeat-containing protein, partial [Candidatus Aminicenantes bacterium]|nr:VCBS repeat-containing protein [Candidatus Aminicenantes bacterium]
MIKKKRTFKIIFIVILLLMNFCSEEEIVIRECPQIELVDLTIQAGLARFQMTFGVAVVDINNDGRDDLVIGNHGELPCLFINRGGVFEDYSDRLPDQVLADRHGVTAVDLENDGDKDLLFAGGGADGVGVGCKNRLYENLFSDTGNLAFEHITAEVGIEFQPWRSRHFLPLPSGDGSMIDLYLVCLVRENCPDLYFSNLSQSSIRLEVNESPGLNQNFSSEGRDLFFDFDRDGDQDLLIVSKSKPHIYEKINNHYYKNDTLIPDMDSVFCPGVGDLNNDGYPDLYLGRESVPTKSDNLSYNDTEIHFVFRKHEADVSDRINFDVGGGSIYIDFVQHLPTGETILDPSNIFIGQKKQNPPARRATILAGMAEGEPVRDLPGEYIWKDPGTNLWHVEWVYTEDRKDKGKIIADSIGNVVEENLEIFPPIDINDRIFINQNGIGFEELVLPELTH